MIMTFWRRHGRLALLVQLPYAIAISTGFLSPSETPTEVIELLLKRYATKKGSRVSCLAKTSFNVFGKGVLLVSGSSYAETEPIALRPSLDL